MKVMNQPVPNGFEAYATQDGVFIRNIRDGKVFKWQPIRNLVPNGIDRNGKSSRYGRRSFDGPFNDLEGDTYQDPESAQFEKTVRKHGGFYISVEKFKPCYKSKAERSAKNYLLGSVDAISALPSGEAFDCLFEYIYERFRKYVLKNQKSDETPYEAWNRIAEEQNNKFMEKGIYGIKGLMDHQYEHTSELGGGCYAYRGEFRMILISYVQRETRIDPKDVAWCLGLRNFCHPDCAKLGYRIMILPK